MAQAPKYKFQSIADPVGEWNKQHEQAVRFAEVFKARKRISKALAMMVKKAKAGDTLPRKNFETLAGLSRLTVTHGDTVVPIDGKPFVVMDFDDAAEVIDSVRAYVDDGMADADIAAAIDAPAEPNEAEPKKRGRGRPKKGS